MKPLLWTLTLVALLFGGYRGLGLLYSEAYGNGYNQGQSDAICGLNNTCEAGQR